MQQQQQQQQQQKQQLVMQIIWKRQRGIISTFQSI